MSSLNQVNLIGNLGADPEIRVSPGGNRIATFSMATTDKWKDKQSGDLREQTEWHRIVCFVDGLTGVIEKYLRKGSRVFVQGRLQTRSWEDNEGIKRWSTEIVIPKIGGKMVMLNDHGGSRPPEPPPETRGDLDDEIPF